MPAASCRIMPARSISRCETISASFGFSFRMGRKNRDNRMGQLRESVGHGKRCSETGSGAKIQGWESLKSRRKRGFPGVLPSFVGWVKRSVPTPSKGDLLMKGGHRARAPLPTLRTRSIGDKTRQHDTCQPFDNLMLMMLACVARDRGNQDRRFHADPVRI